MSAFHNRVAPMKVPLRIEGSKGVTVFQIRSVVVPWKAMGVDQFNPVHKAALRKVRHEIMHWLDTKCRRYEIRTGGVWFLDPDDAMMFKLKWSGMIVG